MSPYKRESRRAKRFDLKLPLLISSETINDPLQNTPAETVSVSRTGLKLKCSKPLRKGMYVRLVRPGSDQSKLARVVWAQVGQNEETIAGLALALQLRNPRDFWGGDYPASDRPDTHFWQDEVEPATTEAEPAGPKKEEPAPSVARAAESGALRIPTEGVKVLVRGVSAARMPFQEESVLVPTGENEGRVSIRPVVDDGKLVQVLFLAEGRVMKARTDGSSRRRPDGKMRVWLRFEQPLQKLPE